jgi:uncharacterized protein YutE (UPF0331/DUF86 family)
MTPSELRPRIIAERVNWIQRMLADLRSLPLESFDSFHSDPRNSASAESYLRRALEAFFDLGRHILAKGFGRPVSEYKEIARGLVEVRVLEEKDGNVLRQLAGYRNRLVHFYNEISERELYEICSNQLEDAELLLSKLTEWIRVHPELMASGN